MLTLGRRILSLVGRSSEIFDETRWNQIFRRRSSRNLSVPIRSSPPQHEFARPLNNSNIGSVNCERNDLNLRLSSHWDRLVLRQKNREECLVRRQALSLHSFQQFLEYQSRPVRSRPFVFQSISIFSLRLMQWKKISFSSAYLIFWWTLQSLPDNLLYSSPRGTRLSVVSIRSFVHPIGKSDVSLRSEIRREQEIHVTLLLTGCRVPRKKECACLTTIETETREIRWSHSWARTLIAPRNSDSMKSRAVNMNV